MTDYINGVKTQLATSHGEMYQNDNSTATTINTINVWEEVGNFSGGELLNVSFANDSLTVATAATYHIVVSLSTAAASPNKNFEFAISVNDTIVDKTKIERRFDVGDKACSEMQGVSLDV